MSDINQTLEQIRSVLDRGDLLTDAEDISGRVSWPGIGESCPAAAVVRPVTTEEVSAVMRICHEAGQPVVTHGGRTGLVGAIRCRPEEIVVSMERMNKIEEIDELGRTMTVQAGVPLQMVQETAEKHGLLFPLDMGARGSCQIGGNVVTNAGGNRVIRYGMTRELVLGL